MNFNYFDIHSHLNFSQFDEDREIVIQAMRDQGIGTICVGTSLKTSGESVALAEEHDHIWATVGIHPTDWEEVFDTKAFEELVVQDRVVAVGETGLDYYRDQEHKSEQKELFEAQIALANDHDLPLMLHGRPSAGSMDAYEDMLEVLSASYSASVSHPGHVHFFAGDTAIARRFLEIGFTIGFDGPVTFSRDYDEVVRFVPLDRLCAETDAPFAAPDPYRGRRNSPLYVPHIVETLARIRGEDLEVVKQASVENAKRVF